MDSHFISLTRQSPASREPGDEMRGAGYRSTGKTVLCLQDMALLVNRDKSNHKQFRFVNQFASPKR